VEDTAAPKVAGMVAPKAAVGDAVGEAGWATT
jgi:hypothetical protein